MSMQAADKKEDKKEEAKEEPEKKTRGGKAADKEDKVCAAEACWLWPCRLCMDGAARGLGAQLHAGS